MPKFKVVKVLRFEYELESDTEDAARAAIPELILGGVGESKITTIRESVKNLDKQAAPVNAIVDRKMRAGRMFTRTYRGVVYTATVIPGGRIKLEGGDFTGIVYKNLNKATQAILGGKSANARVFWHEGPQEASKSDTIDDAIMHSAGIVSDPVPGQEFQSVEEEPTSVTE
jgi:hypothetical protein